MFQAAALLCAKSYVRRIRLRFSHDPERHRVYHEFCSLLSSYQYGQRDVQQVHDGVKRLFRSHPDLLHEFSRYLPNTSENSTRRRPRSEVQDQVEIHRPRTRARVAAGLDS